MNAQQRVRLSRRQVIAVCASLVGSTTMFLIFRMHHDFFDLRIYRAAIRWWADGNRLYEFSQPDVIQDRLYFTYPPISALIIAPLTWLPMWAMATVSVIGTMVLVTTATRWMVTDFVQRRHLQMGVTLAVAMPVVLSIEPIRETILLGQINSILMVLIVADVMFFVSRRKFAGAGIGIATALKLVPGVFIAYLIVKREFKAAAVAVSAAIATTLLAGAVSPSDSWDFWLTALWDTSRVGKNYYTGNQSILGLLSRWWYPTEPSRMVWLGVVAIFAVIAARRVSRSTNRVADLAVVGMFGGLASPITWPHHMWWMIPAGIVLVDHGWPAPGERIRLNRHWIGLAAILVVNEYGVLRYVSNSMHGPASNPVEFLLRNSMVFVAIASVVWLPITKGSADAAVPVQASLS